MPHALRQLIAQQTTPDDMAAALLVVVVAVLAAAFILYGLILLALWALQLHRSVRLRELFFPTRSQWHEFLGEYLLAGVTSVLLALSIAARNNVVQNVLHADLASISGRDVRHALPLADVSADDLAAPADANGNAAPDALARQLSNMIDRSGHDAVGGAAKVGLESLIVPLLQAGMDGKALALVQHVVERRAQDDPALFKRFPTGSDLLLASILLIVLYGFWFAWMRSRRVAKSEEEVETSYRQLATRLLPLAICVGLLLMSAASTGNTRRTADAVVSAARSIASHEHAGAGLSGVDAKAARRFAHAIARQRGYLHYIRPAPDSGDSLNLWASVSALRASVDPLKHRSTAMADTLHQQSVQLGKLRRELHAQQQALATLRDDRKGLKAALQARTQQFDSRLTSLSKQLDQLRADNKQAEADQNRYLDSLKTGLSMLQTDIHALEKAQGHGGRLLVIGSRGMNYRLTDAKKDFDKRGHWVTAYNHLQPGRYTAVATNTHAMSATVYVSDGELSVLELVPPHAAITVQSMKVLPGKAVSNRRQATGSNK